MSSTVGAKFELTATDKTSAAFQSAHNHLSQLSRSADQFSKSAGGMGAGISGLLKGFSAAAGPLTLIVAGIGAVVAAGKLWFDINDELQKQEVKLSTAISNTGRTLGFSAKQAEQYAQYLQDTTTVSKESVMQLETNLASSRAIATSNIKGATQALLDMAAATNKDAATLSTVFTEALANPAKAFTTLKTYGVDLNKTQREMIANAIKAGDASKAQKVIIDATEAAYAHQAEAMRGTMGGALEGLKHAFEDLFESSGKSTGGIAKFINQISAVLESPGFKQALAYIGDAFSIAFQAISIVAKVISAIDHIIVDEIIIGLHDVIVWIEKGAKAVYGFLSQFKIFNTIIDAVKTYFLEFVNWIIKEADKVLAYFHKHIDELNAQADKITGLSSTMPKTPVDESGPTHDTKGTGFVVEKDKHTKDVLTFLDKIKAQKEQISSIKIISVKETEGMKAYYNQLSGFMKGTKEYQLKEYNDNVAVIKASVGTTVDGIKITAQIADEEIKKLNEQLNQSKNSVSNFAVEAQKNLQDAFAKFFENTHEGFKGMVRDFAKTMEKMAANAVAAQLAQKLFPSSGTGSTGGSGWAGIFQSIFSSWGGAHAAGGTAAADKISLVGEAGPELLIPHNNMDVIPNNQLSRMGGTTNHNINIDARGAGPDETAKLISMRNDIIATMRGDTEMRLQRGNWMNIS